MTDENDMDVLSGLWQNDESLSVGKDILKRVRRETLRMRLLVILEIILLSAVGAVILWLTLLHPAPIVIGSAVFTITFLLAGGIISFWSRRKLWGSASESTKDLLDLSIRRIRMFIWVSKLAAILIFPATLSGLIFGQLIAKVRQAAAATVWPSLLEVGIALAASVVISLIIGLMIRRKSRELARLQAVRDEFEEA